MPPRFFGWLGGVAIGLLLLIIGWAALSPGFFHDAFLWTSFVWLAGSVGGTVYIADKWSRRDFLGQSAVLSVITAVVFSILFALSLGWLAMLLFLVGGLVMFCIAAATAK